MSAAALEVSAGAEAPKERATQLSFFEGQRITEHALTFTGNIDVLDTELVAGLKLGTEVEIVVRGKVTGRSHKLVREDGVVTGTRSGSTVTVESIE